MKFSMKIRLYKFLKFISFLLIIITLFLILSNLFINLFLTNITSNDKYNLDEPVSFLLLGTDKGSERSDSISGVRSDSVMVGTLNPNNSRDHIEMNLISIPRDTLVYTPCATSTDGSPVYNKLADSTNSGYEQNQNIGEGIACTKSAVENLLNIDIDYYIETGFDGVINIINAIGGINVEVPYDFCEQNENDEGTYGEDRTTCGEEAYYFTKGEQHLSGEEALAYARQRKASSDYDRGIRQQQVIIATLEKILSNPSSYADDFVKVFLKSFESNLTTSDLWKFINFGSEIFNKSFEDLSKNKNIIIDMKTSPYQNTTDTGSGLNSKESSKQNIEPEPISNYYSTEDINPFEEETMVSRYLLTNNSTSIATDSQLKLLSKEESEKSTNSNSLVLEISAYSPASTELTINGGAYSYFDYDTLYYASNLFRTSLNEEEESPIFDYAAAGLNETEAPVTGETYTLSPEDPSSQYQYYSTY